MLSDKGFRKQIELLKKQKIAAKKVVSLEDFRQLQKDVDSKTILIVDDDEIMRNAMKRIFENEGYNVVIAKDGLEVSKVIETHRLDLILLDVNLPWVDGIELTQLIKSHMSLKTVPLILVSAQKTPEDIERGLSAGADDYIVKPFDIDHITQIVRDQLLKSS